MSDPRELYLTQARELVEHLESGNDAEVERLLDHLAGGARNTCSRNWAR